MMTVWASVSGADVTGNHKILTAGVDGVVSGNYAAIKSALHTFSGSNVLLRVPHGASVTIVSPGTDWCKVKYNGTTGYMMTYFLK